MASVSLWKPAEENRSGHVWQLLRGKQLSTSYKVQCQVPGSATFVLVIDAEIKIKVGLFPGKNVHVDTGTLGCERSNAEPPWSSPSRFLTLYEMKLTVCRFDRQNTVAISLILHTCKKLVLSRVYPHALIFQLFYEHLKKIR